MISADAIRGYIDIMIFGKKRSYLLFYFKTN